MLCAVLPIEKEVYRNMSGKKKLLHLVYGRTIFVAIAIVAQVLLLLEFFNIFRNISPLISFVLVILIVNSHTNPVFKLAWIIPIMIFPVFGGLIYLFFTLQSSPRKINKRMQDIFKTTKPLLEKNENVQKDIDDINPQMSNLSKYILDCGGYPPCENTDVKFFSSGEEKFESLLDELEKAEKFIFLEYFIINYGYMWDKILEILKRKAAQGVEVRVMYDGLCCLALLPFHYPKQLKQYDIKCKMFSPIRPVLSSYQNNRDHRKIFVIDGKVAYTGGVNLADNYINRTSKYGHWKDTAIRLEGDAVNNFTIMFLEMWNITERESEDYEKYIVPKSDASGNTGKGFVIPYGDSPYDEYTVGKDVYLDILNTAKHNVKIMTPYLVMDNEMLTALLYCARRGVDVSIILPHISDSPTTFMLARRDYPTLINAGIKIYEYTPGFVHAKEFISDGEKAVVGSINMDYRSLYLHFECAAMMYKCPVISDISDDYENTRAKCQLMTLEDCKKFPWYQKVGGALLKFIAPLL